MRLSRATWKWGTDTNGVPGLGRQGNAYSGPNDAAMVTGQYVVL